MSNDTTATAAQQSATAQPPISYTAGDFGTATFWGRVHASLGLTLEVDYLNLVGAAFSVKGVPDAGISLKNATLPDGSRTSELQTYTWYSDAKRSRAPSITTLTVTDPVTGPTMVAFSVKDFFGVQPVLRSSASVPVTIGSISVSGGEGHAA